MTITSTGVDTTYNGWANYHTWNVSLYIQNEYPLYKAAQSYASYCKELGQDISYEDFHVNFHDLMGDITPDGVSWTDPDLDHDELNEMLAEL